MFGSINFFGTFKVLLKLKNEITKINALKVNLKFLMNKSIKYSSQIK